MSHKAAETALPVARALSLMYPDKPEYDYVANTYMFGDSLLVAVFDMKVTLPEGKWIDYFTGDVYEGNQTIDYKIPEGYGGALMVKAGSVFATVDPTRWIEEKPVEKYTVNVYPGADAEFKLYEDDGYTYDYENGAVATTRMAIENTTDAGFDVVIDAREGSFDGRAPKENAPESDPEIPAMCDVTALTVKIFGEMKAVELDGKAVDFTVTDGFTYFEVSAEAHAAGKLTFKVTK